LARKGFKPVNGFDKDRARAAAAGKKSRWGMPAELKEARYKAVGDIEAVTYKYLYKSLDELKSLYTTPGLPYLDLIIIRTLIKGLEMGDFGHLEPILARSVGRVADKLEVTGTVESYREIVVRMESMSDEEATQKYFELIKTVS
jgi:hypothetical protein